MKRYIIGLAIIFLMVSKGYAAEMKPLAARQEAMAEFKLAPDFKLQDSYKNEYSLSKYKNNQPVVLFFWTTWCPFCRKELSSLNARYLELARYGFELLAINVGESPEKVDKVVKGYSLAFNVLLDKDTSVAQSYDIMGVPTYVLIDKQGKVISTDHSFPEGKYKDLISR